MRDGHRQQPLYDIEFSQQRYQPECSLEARQ